MKDKVKEKWIFEGIDKLPKSIKYFIYGLIGFFGLIIAIKIIQAMLKITF